MVHKVLVAIVDFVEKEGVVDAEHLILEECGIHLFVFLLADALVALALVPISRVLALISSVVLSLAVLSFRLIPVHAPSSREQLYLSSEFG